MTINIEDLTIDGGVTGLEISTESVDLAKALPSLPIDFGFSEQFEGFVPHVKVDAVDQLILGMLASRNGADSIEGRLNHPDGKPVGALESNPHRLSGDLEQTGYEWDKAQVAEILQEYPDGKLPDDHFLAKHVKAEARPSVGADLLLMEALKSWRGNLTPLTRDLDSRAFVEGNSSNPAMRTSDPLHKWAMDNRTLELPNPDSESEQAFPKTAQSAEPKASGAVLTAMPVAKER